MKWLPFNANDQIKVKLTEHGIKVLNNIWQEVSNEFHRPFSCPYKPDERGYYTFQLWVFMEQFGEHINSWNVNNPFQMGMYLEIEDDILMSRQNKAVYFRKEKIGTLIKVVPVTVYDEDDKPVDVWELSFKRENGLESTWQVGSYNISDENVIIGD